MDTLLVHIGKITADKKEIILPPLGTLYLAEYLNQHNISAKIINLNLGKMDKNIFQLFSLIKKGNIKIIGLPLHWHQQSFNVISLICKLKNNFPDIKTVIGGNTATFFHQEIINNFPLVDFIIRGDAEIPLLKLTKKILANKKSFSDIPNLTWKNNKVIIINKQNYTCSERIINNIKPINPDLFLNKNSKTAIFNPIRGCTGNCPYCGGGTTAQKILYKRNHLLFLPIEKALKTIRKMHSLGINHLYFPVYIPKAKKYYLNLFKRIRNDNLKFYATLESYCLADKQFIKKFSMTFYKKSTLILSPDTGSNKLRKRIKTFFYSNKTLIDSLETIIKNDINVDLQFSTGFPFETKKDFAKTIALIEYLKKFPISFGGNSIELEPASPMYLHPKRYKINIKRKSFFDFITASKQQKIGYSTENFLEKEIILNNQYLKKIYEK